MATAEPFPLLNTTAVDQLRSAATAVSSGNSNDAGARRRRKSSGLGGDIRAGDTGAPGLATSIAHLNAAHGSHHVKDSKDITSITTSKRFSKRRKARTILRRAKHFAMRHTWVLPLIIIAIFLSLYAMNPTESNPIHNFIFLSYRIPLSATPDAASPQYGKGLWDIAFVSFYTVVLSFTREFIMQEILRPLARKAGLNSRGKQQRFQEQMYTALYFGILGPAGMYVMSRTPVWYFDTKGMYADFPHKTHEAVFKFYYLFQAAYWAQQAIVLLLGMEKPRKDFKELVGHHIVSLALIGLSYRFHFTYMGLAVYVTHDISDFFLATSKTLNYLEHPLTGPYFLLFMGVWIYMRHFLNLRIIVSLFNEYQTVGPYELNWETEQYKSWVSNVITLALLSSLQALNLFWLALIIRIAYRFLTETQLADERSDYEEDEEEGETEESNGTEETKKHQHTTPLLNGAVNANANGKAKTRTGANGSARKAR